MTLLATAGFTDFIIIAAIMGVVLYGWELWNDSHSLTAIKLRKDGTRDYHRVPTDDKKLFPTWIKIAIFIVVASVLFIPLDFILNRS